MRNPIYWTGTNLINNTSFDIVIVGGGLVGNSLALALADHAKVAVIEASASNTSSNDERALALSYSSYRVFQALKIWEKLSPYTTPIKQVHVSDAGHFGITHFNAQDYHIDALGYVITAHVLLQQLRTSIQQHPKICSLYSCQVEKIMPFPQGYRLQLRTGEETSTITTRLLVGADGIYSNIRTLLGIAATEHHYSQTAITARLQFTHDHDFTAFERFSSSAVLATLPRAKCQANIVWTVDSKRALDLQQLPTDEFCRQFQQAFGTRLGTFNQVEMRQSYPLRSLHTQEQVRPHAVLIGNAAHTLHPVAAQGFNLSLRDIAVLVQVIRDALVDGKNPGDLSVLENYRIWRNQQQAITMKFTQGIVTLFAKNNFPFTLIRDLGLCGIEITPRLKNTIARQAMGIADNLPMWVFEGC